MITLFTPHPESMHDPAGVEKALDEVRKTARQIAKTITNDSRMSDHRVLVISASGAEIAPESFTIGPQSPLTVRIRRGSSNEAVGTMQRAIAITSNICRVIEDFCHFGMQQSNLVFIDDADYYFFPHSEPGKFTQTLDSDVGLMNQINALGECLSGYYGHLILVAALSQYPARMRRFLDDYGWSWVKLHRGRLEHDSGTLPPVLAEYCSPKREAEPESDWSEWMGRTKLAKVLGISRNKPTTRWLEANRDHVEQRDNKYRFHLSIVSTETRKRLIEMEGRDFEDRLKRKK